MTPPEITLEAVPSVGDVPAEDWDVLTRIGINGWAGGYFPGPTVSHHHGRKRPEARKRIRCYNIGSGSVYLKLLADARIAIPNNVAYVAVDFERDSLADALSRAGLDGRAGAVFAWEPV